MGTGIPGHSGGTTFVARLFSSLARFAAITARLLPLLVPLTAPAQTEPIGVVVMHGKGGMPGRYVSDLARALEGNGYLVANIEMPWSRNRNYDVPVAKGEEEVEAAVAGLRGKGAKKVFVAGHSQGGAFALHMGGKLNVDGIICIAPGGDVATPFYQKQVGDTLARARQLVAEGKGAEPARLADFEGSRGLYPITSTPAAYVSWFDPDGAMNMTRAARAAKPEIPILWIAPTNDYPALRKANPALFRALPPNRATRQYELASDHLNAPAASADEIVRWTREVAAAARPR
jgi:dienelactone hydrolase